MPPKKIQTLTSWGNYPKETCTTFRPEKQRDVEDIFVKESTDFIPRGAGMSYGDASLNKEGVIASTRLNRFLAFDIERGIISAQPGVTLQEILAITVPQGWFLPVIPGTKHATLGGAIASNVHGKNHYRVGDLGSHITNLKLRLPNGEVVSCSPEEQADMFWATCGGMGMTGFIEEASIQLIPISSIQLETESQRMPNIKEMIELFRAHLAHSEYMVGWIDHFARGDNFGQGIFERAKHVQKTDSTLENYTPPKPGISVPFNIPSFVLNKYSMAIYNKIRFAGVAQKPTAHTQSFESFFHPLDSIGQWNRLYGKRGFLQYQCLVPDSDKVAQHLQTILETIQQRGCFSFLAVVKYHGPSEGMMTFSDEGFSLALDFPNTAKVHELLYEIDEYLCGIGGRVYLTKDARLAPEHFEKMYGARLTEWRRMLHVLDPEGHMHSSLSERLNFRGDE